MKIGGPKLPVKPPIGGPAEGKVTTKKQDTSFAEALRGPQKKTAQASPGQNAIGATKSLESIVAALRTGEINPHTAIGHMVDGIVSARKEELTPGLRDELRETLQRVIDTDPTFSTKLRKLIETLGSDE